MLVTDGSGLAEGRARPQMYDRHAPDRGTIPCYGWQEDGVLRRASQQRMQKE